jgi:pimeloyl-ACP methyl ester carboxylesterase
MTSLHHINTNGLRISYGVYGSGNNSLMLFHGLVGSARLESSEIKMIEAYDLRLIIVNRPGYGESECFEMNSVCDFVPMAGSVLDELEINRLDLVGISAGAPYAWAAAAAWGDRVKELFILSGVPAIYKPEILDLYTGKNLAFYKAIVNMSLQDQQALFCRIMTGDELENLGHGEARTRLAESTGNNCHGMANQSRIQIRNWGMDFDQIRSKVNLFHSPADEEVPFEAAQKMGELVPDALLTVDGKNQVQKSGEHMASIDRGMAWMLARYQKPDSQR